MRARKLKIVGKLVLENIRPILIRAGNWLHDLAPSPGAERGAVISVGVIVICLGTYLGVKIQTGFGFLFDFILSFIVGALGCILAFLVVKIGLAILKKIPSEYFAALVTGWIALLIFFEGIPWEALWHISILVVVSEILLGVILFEIIKGGWRSAKLHKRVLLWIWVILVVVGNVGFVTWLVHPGVDDYLIRIEPYQGKPSVKVDNPSEPGPYLVKTLNYGSGVDQRRTEFGENVDIVTKSVDATSFFWLDKWEGIIRNWYWGFGADKLPLNGRVWYPDGDGPFPLILMVHGNHYMHDYSDTGYEYLGELLASRGYIFVSVDENFLNGYLTGPVNWENDARGWLILKHLEIWQSWNQTPESPFEGLVDIDRVALIGHSRGGEAVVHAAAFNRLTHYPDNANIHWDFNFGIRSVVAIAPVDHQYQPANHPTSLVDINYLILQGAHDADLSKYDGFQQYQRVHFSDPKSGKFKAGLYIYQANHSQFNSVWGSRDFSVPRGLFLNQTPLLSPEEHQQIAKVTISAFLDVTLRGNEVYRPIFEDYRNAGTWLPPTLYINQYQNAGFLPVVNYEEDFDVATTTLEGGMISAYNLSSWKEDEIKFRTGSSQHNHAVLFGWNGLGPWYQIKLPKYFPKEVNLDGDDCLIFIMADGRGLDHNGEILDFSILLVDDSGESASVGMGEVNRLLPPLPVQFTKLVFWEEETYKNPIEPVFQTFRIPLAKFQENNPPIRLDLLNQIRLVFDQIDSGEIILDEVGFELN